MDPRKPLSELWRILGGPPEAPGDVVLEGEGRLPSVYPVAEVAVAQIAAATLAVREVLAIRSGETPKPVRVWRSHAVAAFRSERYLEAKGSKLPGAWDAIAGDYETRDGWIRLHTNYAHHRDAVLKVLGTPSEREAVARAVGGWTKVDLETAVVAAGGAAAAMHAPSEWAAHPQGLAVAAEPLVAVETVPAPPLILPSLADAPLAGLRVLDLTRVIAGPVCTRFLAGFGAEVLRVDPPGFEEVGALLGDTTAGKRRAFLDLRATKDRVAFEELVQRAHVVVNGYHGGALAKLGYDKGSLRAHNPSLIIASLTAYGSTGPWRERRGFDSLVQMSAGIAARGQELARAARPTPLPAQALDHGTGYMLAAAVGLAAARAVGGKGTSAVSASLARTARWLMDHGEDNTLTERDYAATDAAPWLEESHTVWGEMARVRCPGVIGTFAPRWPIDAGPLGSDAPVWSSTTGSG